MARLAKRNDRRIVCSACSGPLATIVEVDDERRMMFVGGHWFERDGVWEGKRQLRRPLRITIDLMALPIEVRCPVCGFRQTLDPAELRIAKAYRPVQLTNA